MPRLELERVGDDLRPQIHEGFITSSAVRPFDFKYETSVLVTRARSFGGPFDACHFSIPFRLRYGRDQVTSWKAWLCKPRTLDAWG